MHFHYLKLFDQNDRFFAFHALIPFEFIWHDYSLYIYRIVNKQDSTMNKLIIFFLLSVTLTLSMNAQDSTKSKNQNTEKEKAKTEKSKDGQNKTQNQHGRRFVDENGDGYNDNAPDHDGDGIPNGLDPDYTGSKSRRGNRGFIDLNGDGINDNIQNSGNKGNKARHGKGGQKAGSGNMGVAPQGETGRGYGKNSGNTSGNGSKGNTGSGSNGNRRGKN
jgi:hypothetical protein